MPPIKPPVVWHLDTSEIKDKKNPNKDDRLTRIKNAMIEFQDGRKQLEETLQEFTSICDEDGTPPDSEDLK